MIVGLKRNHELVGAIGGLVANDPSDGMLVMQEAFWFVHPLARGRKSLSMVRDFERFAAERGCKRIFLGRLADDERLAKYYVRQGYLELETFHAKELS